LESDRYLSDIYHLRMSMPSATAFLQKIIRQIDESGANRVTAIHLALGELSEPDPAAFQTQWNELTKNTPLEQARLRIRLIPAEVQCMACFQTYRPVEKRIHCPHCGSFGAKILTGEECILDSIETGHDQN
jgi:hydrogenase nickel incorporation protein HypA/HybF